MKEPGELGFFSGRFLRMEEPIMLTFAVLLDIIVFDSKRGLCFLRAIILSKADDLMAVKVTTVL